MPLDNFGVVVPQKLYRCAQPDARGLTDLYALGVRTILKLSTDAESPLLAEQRGFTGGVLPFAISMMPAADDLRLGVATLVKLTGEGPVAVHCMKGRDRTGALVGAWRLLVDGWPFPAMMLEREVFGAGMILDATADHYIVAALRTLDSERCSRA